MSRRTSGPRIAQVYPAFVFPCRECSEPVYRFTVASENGGPVRSPDDPTTCGHCGHVYSDQEIEIAHTLGIMKPCNTFNCPYCRTLGIAMSVQESRFGGSIPILANQRGKNDPQIIGSLEQQGYRWDLPKLTVCDGCHRPVRLSAEGCMFLRAFPVFAGVADTSKPARQTKAPTSFNANADIPLTPKMGKF